MLYFIFDVIGIIAFAISGVMVAMDKKLDLFGVFIVAFVAAVGGGTLRDLLIGDIPILWLKESVYTYIIAGTVFFAILLRNKLEHVRTSLLLFDAIGLEFFTLVGIAKGVNIGLMPIMCIALGTMTACFGGVIRDILCNGIPVIFRKEIYATICILGGVVFFILKEINLTDDLIYLFTSSLIITIRLVVVIKRWRLPRIT